MSEPHALVEHFFRHEFGRLCAVLTRSLGVRRLDLVEDVVQAALEKALETWSRRGVPEAPAGWLYRTARNLAIETSRHTESLPLGLSFLAFTQHGGNESPRRFDHAGIASLAQSVAAGTRA